MSVTSHFDHEFYAVDPKNPTGYPTLVVMHGRGDSLKPFRQIREELGLKKINLLLLNAPRKYLDGYTWYAFPPHQGREVALNRERLKALTTDLDLQGFDLKSVFFLGFSQGALMSVDFAMNAGVEIGGVMALSGYVYFFDQWKKKLTSVSQKLPMLVSHGTFDSALSFDETEEHVKRLIAQGLKVEWHGIEKDHEIVSELDGPICRAFVKRHLKYRQNIAQQYQNSL